MRNVVIVTMFFPLGRESWKGFNRTDDEYFAKFKKWAYVDSELYVFTVQKFKEEVFTIRKSFGLENKTKIICVEDISKLDKQLYDSIFKAMDCEEYKKYRFYNKSPETLSPLYNYVMMLKNYFIFNVSRSLNKDYLVVWHDFGFNYNIYPSKLFSKNIYNFENRITVYKTEELDDSPIFDIIKWTRNYITGCIYCVPNELCEHLWTLSRDNMINLNKAGLCDQDQTILLMSVRECQDLFDVLPFSIVLSEFNYKGIPIDKESKLHIYRSKVRKRINKIKYSLREIR